MTSRPDPYSLWKKYKPMKNIIEEFILQDRTVYRNKNC